MCAALAEVELEMIKLAIDHYNGQMSEVARRLGIGRSTLYRKLKEYGIDPETGRVDRLRPKRKVEPACNARIPCSGGFGWNRQPVDSSVHALRLTVTDRVWPKPES